MAKLISVLGKAPILDKMEPVFGMSYRSLLGVAGVLELAVFFICLLAKNLALKLSLVAWLATAITLYRVGLPLVGYHQACPCLGNLTEMLHIPPHSANSLMKGVLVYLFFGSYAGMIYLWSHKKDCDVAS